MNHSSDRGGSSKGCFFWGCMTVIVLAVLVIAGGGGLVFYGYQGQAALRETATAYLEATHAGDYERAYELLSPSWREKLDLDGFIAGEQQRRANQGECEAWRMAGMNVHSATGQGSLADLSYQATCGDEVAAITLHLVKSDGQWLVDGADYGDPAQIPEMDAPGACPSCGSVNPPGANFCSRCGERLRELEEAPP